MADEPKGKVTLKVPASGGDLGVAGAVGDTVEVDADVAERWVAAGIADVDERTASAPKAAPAPKPTTGKKP